MRLCFGQAFLQRGTGVETAHPGAGANPQAVLADAVDAHQPAMHQLAKHLGEQLVQRLLMPDAEIVERVVVHAQAAAHPLET